MDWKRKASQLLRAELVKEGISYAQLATKLQKADIKETERSVANKMSRGTFGFNFFLQCMHALGKNSVTLDLSLPMESLQKSSLVESKPETRE
jgi:hypothetical protein